VDRLLPSRRAFAIECAAVAAIAVLLRVPFMGTIGPDEGGYAYVAWRWSHGADLYRTLWIDRPQGLLLVYRGLIAIAPSPWAIRLGAVVAAAATALLLVAVGSLLVSRTVGLLAGALYAVVGVGPRIEGYTFNGELAAAVPSTAAVAAALLGARRRSTAWFAAAGALGGTAILMKQSGFDGLVVALVVAAAAGRRRLLVAATAASLPLGASALGGWLAGWSFYWSQLVTSHVDVATNAARLAHFDGSIPRASRDLLPLAVLAAVGAWRARRLPGVRRPALTWLVAALVAVNVGGLYWPHYYVQLLPPLSLLAAVALGGLSPRRAWIAAAAVALPAVFFVGHVVGSGDPSSDRLVKYAVGFENDRRVAAYVRAHSSPRDEVYAFVSRADFYFLARRPAASPYLWAHPLKDIPGAEAALVRTLAGPRRPRLVALFQRPKRNAFGRAIGRILARDYRVVWRAPGTATPVLAARPVY